MRTIRAQFEGADAGPGRVAAVDVTRIIIGTITADFGASAANARLVEGGDATITFSAFWEADTFSGLQAAQGTSGRVDPDSLVIKQLNEDERAAFHSALAE